MIETLLYKGDCLIEMNKIADKSVDMILCDLPYGTTTCSWDVIIPFDKLWEQYNRIIKDEELLRLKQLTGLASLFADKEFSKSWKFEE